VNFKPYVSKYTTVSAIRTYVHVEILQNFYCNIGYFNYEFCLILATTRKGISHQK